MDKKSQVIGGGFKKVLYTLNTVRKMGPLTAAKTLKSKNTCKACAFGMGGQLGGMTNEQHEFPSVCNKSIQAQSSDVQSAIPAEVFDHPIAELRELDALELEHLGRLTSPIWKAKGDVKFSIVDWDFAINKAAERLKATAPERSFFYSSGRSSNEAGFLFQLMARLYGTNNVTNCSYYCHQATAEGLGSTIGTGTSTVELADLDGADLIFVIGANPASNHPRFIHKLKNCRARGGNVVVINPAKEAGLVKFAVPKSAKSLLKGGDDIASLYLQPNIGSDVAVHTAIAKAIIESSAENTAFIEQFTDHYAEFAQSIAQTSWQALEASTGLPKADIDAVAALYQQSKTSVFAWGMGLTHHINGVDNIEAVANLALLRGMVGKPNAGLLPLRGHSNVQGIGSMGVKPQLTENVVAAIEKIWGIKLPTEKGLHTLASLEAAERGGIDAAVILGGNLFSATPNTTFATRALNKIAFKMFMTTTLNAGHINAVDNDVLVLPVTARDEEWSATTQESMFNFVRLSDGGIIRHAGVRPESVILAELATAILPNLDIDFSQFKDHEKTRQWLAKIIPGLEPIATLDADKHEFHVQNRLLHTPDFKTNNKRAQFKILPLPRKNESIDYPFSLATLRSEGQFNSIVYEYKDSYRQTEERWCVMMNAQDINKLGLQAGGRANVTSAHGEMKAVLIYEFDVPAGNILAYYPEANWLIGNDIDPRSKTPSFKNVAVSVSAIDNVSRNA